MACVHSSKYFQRVFTYWLVLVALVCSPERANCATVAVVSRLDGGDKFTNPFKGQKCVGIGARCVEGLLVHCSECVCESGTQTYRADLKRCVSTQKMNNFTGCRYKGINDTSKGLLDKDLPTLDFTQSKTKNIYPILHIPQSAAANQIKCEIMNSTSFLDSNGEWIPLTNINDILHIHARGNLAKVIHRYLSLRWEVVKNDEYYSGRLIKLQISCRTDADIPGSDCFVFKTQGTRLFDLSSPTTSTVATKSTKPTQTTEEMLSGVSSIFTTKALPTIYHSTQKTTSTEKTGINKNYTYSVSMPVIIGVSAGVGLVILIIIILAVCFVRYRTRKHQEAKPAVVNTEAPKVHFTAQARFSLIQEAAPVDPTDDDYTSLKENRESYDPYYSLRKDDVDLNVIDTILKDAVSMESMGFSSSEPRYSCRLAENDAIIIESAKPHSPRQPNYHVLEGPDDVENDYEEVDTSDDEYPTTASRLLDTKPPLPEREYHELERPSDLIQSEC